MLLWLSSIENTRREQPFPGYGAARGTAAGEARYAFAVPLCRQKTLSRKRQFRRAETAFPLRDEREAQPMNTVPPFLSFVFSFL